MTAKDDMHFPGLEFVCLYHLSISQHRVQHLAGQSAAKALLNGLKPKKAKGNRGKGKNKDEDKDGKHGDETKDS